MIDYGKKRKKLSHFCKKWCNVVKSDKMNSNNLPEKSFKLHYNFKFWELLNDGIYFKVEMFLFSQH